MSLLAHPKDLVFNGSIAIIISPLKALMKDQVFYYVVENIFYLMHNFTGCFTSLKRLAAVESQERIKLQWTRYAKYYIKSFSLVLIIGGSRIFGWMVHMNINDGLGMVNYKCNNRSTYTVTCINWLKQL